MEKSERIMKAKVDVLKGMHDYIGALDDEILYDIWTYFIPDGAGIDDFEEIAEDDKLWLPVCDIFSKLIYKV